MLRWLTGVTTLLTGGATSARMSPIRASAACNDSVGITSRRRTWVLVPSSARRQAEVEASRPSPAPTSVTVTPPRWVGRAGGLSVLEVLLGAGAVHAARCARSAPLGEGSEQEGQSEELREDVVLVEGQDRDADAGEHEQTEPQERDREDGKVRAAATPRR